MKNEKKKSVYVGLSGGVDSSVSAALLLEQGYEVTGVFIKVWYPDFIECDWKAERRDAMRVCAHLGIPFRELDLSLEYKRDVVDYMIDEYKKGRTPNPDMMCNRYVKFGAFWDWAQKQGTDFIATGHYSRTRQFPIPNFQFPKNDGHALLQGINENKDQSYFLWMLTQDDLEHILFPVGALEKGEVRSLAEKHGLFTHTKKDSQGLCFLGHVDMAQFLSHFIDVKRGDVLDEKGDVVGYHEGAALYTIGKRHGFTLTKRTPDDKPHFVSAIDVENNTVTVTDDRSPGGPLQNVREVCLENINDMYGIFEDGMKCSARIRYRQDLQPCAIRKGDGEVRVVFDAPQQALAEGQACVLYDGEVCLGGGVMGKCVRD